MVPDQEWIGLCQWSPLGPSGYRLVFNLAQRDIATQVCIIISVSSMSRRDNKELLSRWLEAKLRECRKALRRP